MTESIDTSNLVPKGVKFVETIAVAAGVSCDTYRPDGSEDWDAAIVTVYAGHKTPLQRVLRGIRTIETYQAGVGKLEIVRKTGKLAVFHFDASAEPLPIEVEVGELMQWRASPDSPLVFLETCWPPYQDGRYQNLPG